MKTSRFSQPLSNPTVRRAGPRSLAVGLFCVLLLLEAWVVVVRRDGLASSSPGSREFVVSAEARQVSQVFRMGADGLSAFAFYPVGMATPSDSGVQLELWELGREDSAVGSTSGTLLRSGTVAARALAPQRRFSWHFRPVEQSDGRSYRFVFKWLDVRGVGLRAAESKRHRDRLFFAGENPVWGELLFHTAATRATIAGRLMHRLSQRPNPTLVLVMWLLFFAAGHLAVLGLFVLFFPGNSKMEEAAPVLSRGRYWTFTILTVIGSVLLTLTALMVVDLYLHARFSDAGFNYRGYRGPVLGRKAPGELRIAVLGGSTALGYGVRWRESFPAQLEARLNGTLRPGAERSFSVANLAWNNQGAYSFLGTLRDYRHLDYDLILLYTGYNDLGGPNYYSFRDESPTFRLTGYMPILPVIVRDTGHLLRDGQNHESQYWGRRAVFEPTLVEQWAAGALLRAATVSEALEVQLGRLSQRDESPPQLPEAGCVDRWAHYCASVFRAVDYALREGKQVVLVAQPYIADVHVEQQAAVARGLVERFGVRGDLRRVDLGGLIDLSDRSLAFDGMHLTPEGNRRVAEALMGPVLAALDAIRQQ